MFIYKYVCLCVCVFVYVYVWVGGMFKYIYNAYTQRSTLDGELEETQARYGDQLARFQVTITSLEDQLSPFHANIANHKQEYEMLLDIKTRLECEIAEYRRLLDGDER